MRLCSYNRDNADSPTIVILSDSEGSAFFRCRSRMQLLRLRLRM